MVIKKQLGCSQDRKRRKLDYIKKWRKENPEKIRIYDVRWMKKNPWYTSYHKAQLTDCCKKRITHAGGFMWKYARKTQEAKNAERIESEQFEGNARKNIWRNIEQRGDNEKWVDIKSPVEGNAPEDESPESRPGQEE